MRSPGDDKKPVQTLTSNQLGAATAVITVRLATHRSGKLGTWTYSLNSYN